MTNRKTTKRALLSSVLALILCFAMLLGSTWAWFTDTATTNVNTIKSGILDVDMRTTVNDENSSIVGEALDFLGRNDNNALTNTDLLWEPGVTFETNTFYIVNAGNLALKYQLVLNNAEATDNKLLDVIAIFAVVDNNGKEEYYPMNTCAEQYKAERLAEDTTDERFANVADDLTGNLKANENSGAIKLWAHMLESADNEYQNLEVKNLAVSVYATQDTVEFDKDSNQYDASAELPAKTAVVNEQNALVNAL